MELNTIENFLSENPLHGISVSGSGKKLSKNTVPKNVFTLADIHKRFGSVQGLFAELPALGFSGEVQVTLVRSYENKRTIYPLQTLKINVKKEQKMENTTALQAPAMLGYTQVSQNDWLMAKVKEAKYDDLQAEVTRLRDEVSEAKSRARVLEEKNNALQLKIDTAVERAELKLQRTLLDKKSFWESPVFEQLSGSIGASLGAALPNLLAASTGAVPALGVAQNELSAVKQALVQIISAPNVSDALVEEILQNYFSPQEITPQNP